MNKNLLIGLLGIVIVVGVGYVLLNKPNTAQPTTNTVQNVTPVPAEHVVTLFEQNASNEFGIATLTEKGGKVTVTLKLDGTPLDVVQPAHIHVGACPDVGSVKYPLTSVVNGASETVLDVTLDQLKSEQPLGLNVHKSVAESKIYIACGDLSL